MNDTFTLGPLSLRSRLLMGSARFPSIEVLLAALASSGAELVTVALRRVRVAAQGDNLYALLKARGLQLLPNTAGCFTAEEAVRTAHLAREALATPLIKLEVIADEQTLLPEPWELLKAAERLVHDGFVVLPYTNDDPVTARRLEDLGCAAVMPLAAPIGSGLGLRNPHNLTLIKARAKVPVIVDAGIGTTSDVTQVFELGLDGVLVNSAVARSHDPVRMAGAVKAAALAGREAYLAGRMPKKTLAEASTPHDGRAWR